MDTMETSDNEQDNGGDPSHGAHLKTKCCSIQKQIRASLNDMEPEHPNFESYKNDLSQINEKLKQLIKQKFLKGRDTPKDTPTIMETSDEEVKTKTAIVKVPENKAPQKHKTTQSTLGEAFGVATKKTKSTRGKKWKSSCTFIHKLPTWARTFQRTYPKNSRS